MLCAAVGRNHLPPAAHDVTTCCHPPRAAQVGHPPYCKKVTDAFSDPNANPSSVG